MTQEPILILVADPEKKVHALFASLHKENPHFKFFYAFTSDEAIKIFSQEHIDIAFCDLYLYPVHGLEILKKLKSILPGASVIITSYEPMIQNYRACLANGALDFIPKPFDAKLIHNILKAIVANNYIPQALEEPKISKHPFILKEHTSDTYIKFWGTRGSHTVSGTDYLRFGGNTSCLEVRSGNFLAIIDAGTGLSNLGQYIIEHENKKEIELLLGHTHLDHMAGLPSFKPMHDSKFNVTIRAPINFYKSTKELLRDMLTHAFFPVDLEEVKASLKFKELYACSPFEIGSIKIDCHYTYHPGTTLGFKIKIGPVVLGYITDNEVLMGYSGDPKLITHDHPMLLPHLGFIEFFKGCDVLIHEAQYSQKVYTEKVGWGHSSIYNAATIVKYINPKVWIVSHHDPEDSDEMIQKKYETIVEACNYLDMQCGIRMAFDGLKIHF